MYFLHARDMREFLFGHPLFSFLRGSEPDREQKNRPIGRDALKCAVVDWI